MAGVGLLLLRLKSFLGFGYAVKVVGGRVDKSRHGSSNIRKIGHHPKHPIETAHLAKSSQKIPCALCRVMCMDVYRSTIPQNT